MVTRKSGSKPSKRRTAGPARSSSTVAKSSARSTVSGPARNGSENSIVDAATAKLAGAEALAASFPQNAAKAGEFGSAAPPQGQAVALSDASVTGSTLTEVNASDKVGSGDPVAGVNPTVGSLDRVRVDSGGRALTTNQGVPIADNQNSLKAGLRGPSLLEDFILREKVTHFDHERIPERVVHGYRADGRYCVAEGRPSQGGRSI